MKQKDVIQNKKEQEKSQASAKDPKAKSALEEKLDFRQIFIKRSQAFLSRFPSPLRWLILRSLPKIICEEEINTLLRKHEDKSGMDFVEELFDYLDFSYSMSARDRERIPAEGKLLVVANHPLGALDGLALLKAIREVRNDVKIVVNDILWEIKNLRNCFLPNDDSFHDSWDSSDMDAIANSLKKEEAVIVFPSSEITKLTLTGIQMGRWRPEVISFAKRNEAPILPVYIKAKNSPFFYFFSLFSKRLSVLLISRETLNKKGKTISLRIGDPIPFQYFNAVESQVAVRLLKSHIRAISHNRKGPFQTEKTVIHPVDRGELREEILRGELLGKTDDGKMIFFLSFDDFPVTMREISRLREITFRKMEEGTGSKRDMDEYDRYYRHLVLWDEKALEIVGAYRLGICQEIVDKKGVKGLYVSSLFELTSEFEKYLPETIELGRSFVQQKYWNSQALDYLWHGIGAFLAHNPKIKYMIGPVSISPSYRTEAREMLVYFYKKWFPAPSGLAKSYNSFVLSRKKTNNLELLFKENSYRDDFRILKQNLKHYGATVPTLYKQYTELCDDDGVGFFDFGVDESFGYCVDGLIMVKADKIKDRKRQRYIDNKLPQKEEPAEESGSQTSRQESNNNSKQKDDTPEANTREKKIINKQESLAARVETKDSVSDSEISASETGVKSEELTRERPIENPGNSDKSEGI